MARLRDPIASRRRIYPFVLDTRFRGYNARRDLDWREFGGAISDCKLV
ncbi:MAG: hypothetical protein LBO72_00665 [Helicobacteraceae bacterium]|nr:hypothetical protein [Helicobacteraceae bacterium]